jgi:DNA-binding protein YbaB
VGSDGSCILRKSKTTGGTSGRSMASFIIPRANVSSIDIDAMKLANLKDQESEIKSQIKELEQSLLQKVMEELAGSDTKSYNTSVGRLTIVTNRTTEYTSKMFHYCQEKIRHWQGKLAAEKVTAKRDGNIIVGPEEYSLRFTRI